MGGSWSGSSMRLSASSARNASSGGSWHGEKASGAVDAGRLVSARPPIRRPTRAGSSPRMEEEPRTAAAARGAAVDRLEQEAHGRAGDLEEGRNRRLQVGHQGGPDHLRHAAPITLGEGVRRRFDVHRDWLYGSPPPITWRRAGWLMVTP